MNYWLMKTEPATFGIEDLARAPGGRSSWDGVRNYQARNYLRDEMRLRDQAFLYHSSCETPGIAGIVEVVRTGYPDPTAFDRASHHYDAGSRRDEPRWFMVDVQLRRKLKRVITLTELRSHARKELAGLWILRRGNRLSITPVTPAHWKFILTLE